MKKLFLVPAAAALLMLAACNSSSTTGNVIQNDTSSSVASSADMMNTEPAMDASSSSSVSADATDATSAVHSIDMTVENWKFTPNVIHAKKGETLVIHLKNISGNHSFASRDLNLNVPISEGETKDITIPTDKTGTFSFRCGVPCGEGHKDMTGTIIIE